MTKKKIVFRADGNSEIGLGHIMRTLALADMLKNDFVCVFATRFVTEFIQNEINKVCCETHLLPQDNKHFEFFLNLLNGHEIVVLDNYFFLTKYQKQIKKKGCSLVCLDDMHDKHYVSDIVINHAPGIKKDSFSVSENTKLCLGIDYLMLRNSFFNVSQKKIIEPGIKNNLFVCFGGSDSSNITLKILTLIKNFDAINKISLLISSNYLYKDELEKFLKEHFQIPITIYSDLSAIKLINVIKDCAIAISSASTISYEIISLGLPLIVGYYTNNQINIYNGLTQFSSIFGIGNLLYIKKHQLETILKTTLNITIRENIVDGLSPQRFTKLFKDLK